MANHSTMRYPPRLPPILGERPSATTEFGTNKKEGNNTDE